MFTSIKTSESNKEVVKILTKKLSLGTENHIARLALTYSLSKGEKLSLNNIKDSQGKEYSNKVLFGNFAYIYISMICTLYGIDCYNNDIPKYIKMHIDDGLVLLYKEIEFNPNFIGFDFLIDKIFKGVNDLCLKI